MNSRPNPPPKTSQYHIPEPALAMQIQQRLRELDFALDPPRRNAHGTQIRPRCGAVICVFDTGKVVVQGRLIESVAEESMVRLRQVLPASTSWQCGTRR
jgi:hypothetical protein